MEILTSLAYTKLCGNICYFWLIVSSVLLKDIFSEVVGLALQRLDKLNLASD